MIANIVDSRRRGHRWKNINAIVEATWHDNSVADSDHSEPTGPNADAIDYSALEGVSVADAIAWAGKFEGEVTLFLYDAGEGTSPAKEF